MTKLVLLRHGESIWNKDNLFTGWADVDLSDQGKIEASRAGELLKVRGVLFRRRLLFRPEAGNSNALDYLGCARFNVDPCGTLVAAQREALRRTSGVKQSGDRSQVR